MYFLLREISLPNIKQWNWKKGIGIIIFLSIGAGLCFSLFSPIHLPAEKYVEHSLSFTEGEENETVTIGWVRSGSPEEGGVKWEKDVKIDPSKIESVDIGLVNAENGEPEEVFFSFAFSEGERFVMSIAPQKYEGKSHSFWKSLGWQYPLVYIGGREQDIIGKYLSEKRTVVLYPLDFSSRKSHKLFSSLLARANTLTTFPEEYHPFFYTASTEAFSHIEALLPAKIAFETPPISSEELSEYLYTGELIPHEKSLAEETEAHQISLEREYFYVQPDFSLQMRNNWERSTPTQ